MPAMRSITKLLLFIVLSVLPPARPAQNTASKVLVFTHVTVIDATGAPAKPDMTVVITGDRIAALGKSGENVPAKNAQVVNAKGKFLIPGLWDMHVHTSYKNFLTLFIINGVTGVRDMGGSPKEFAQFSEWRKEVGRGGIIGPRIVAAGIVVDGAASKGRPDSLNVTNDTEARQAVIYLKQRGADFIKVYSLLSREAFYAIADEAKKQQMPIAGHVPAEIGASEAAEAGQKSMEHLFGVLPACSKSEVALLKEAREEIANSNAAVFIRAELRAQARTLDTYDRQKAAALFASFVKNRTWQIPTLAGWRNLSDAEAGPFTGDLRLKYIPRERLESWKGQRTYLQKHITTEYWVNSKRLFQKQLELVGAMYRAGVGIMAGTDTAGFYVTPGFSLHDELELLVKAGLTPMEALQAATRNPARYLGMLDTLGTIEKGKIADLVLLDADPLESIGNTKKIAAVVIGGRHINRAELDRMLAEVETAAGRK